MRVGPDTDPDLIDESWSRQRDSEVRRAELQRLVNFCVDRSTTVDVRLQPSGAACRLNDDGDGYVVLVPTRKYEQVHTDLEPAIWDRAMQIAFLFHELGHVRYSGFDTFHDYLDSIDPRWIHLFKHVYNAGEDVAIEAQMAAELRLRDDFALKNATLGATIDRKHARYVELFGIIDGKTPVRTYTVFEAIQFGILDYEFGAANRFDEIIDPSEPGRVVKGGRHDIVESIEPHLRAYVEDMLSEPDPKARVDRAFEFFELVRSELEVLPPLQRQRLQTPDVRPADVRAVSGWSPDSADALSSDARRGGHGGRSPAGGTGTDGSDAESWKDEPSANALRRAARRWGDAGGEATSAFRRTVERLVGIVSDEETAVDEVLVVPPAEEGGDTDRWTTVKQSAKQLLTDLNAQLRQERRPRQHSGARRGTVDSRNLVAAVRGSERVFTRTRPGREKDYSCQVILDRSISMSDRITAAEGATAKLAYALYALGVDVSVLSLYDHRVGLELPFDVDPETQIDRLVTGRTSGSTPLSDALAVARRRVGRGDGAVSFVIVVTDGEANDVEQYKAQLDRCGCPVFGVYVGDGPDDHEQYFDRVVYAAPAELDVVLGHLARRLFRRGA